MILHRNTLVAITASLLLTGCNLVPTRDSNANHEPPSDSSPAPASGAANENGVLHDVPEADTRHAVYLARNDDAISVRRQQLLDEGHEAVATDRVGYYMDVLTARLHQELADKEVQLERGERSITLTFSGSHTFETNSATIHPDMTVALDALGRVLEEYHSSVVTIAGHTDSSGARAYNQHLSELRALSVGQHLRSVGVGEDRMIAIGYGPSRPIADNDTAQGKAMNRRVELRVEPLTAT